MSNSNHNQDIDQVDPFFLNNELLSNLADSREGTIDGDNLIAPERETRGPLISPMRSQNQTEYFTEPFRYFDVISNATSEAINYPPIYTVDDIYQPTISLTDNARQSEIMRRRMRRRQLKKAQLILTNSLLDDQENRSSYYDPGVPSAQSTRYCDIDANDDATLWMLISLSGKLFRGKRRSGGERDLRERLLIRKIAEKAFNHLFPPIIV